MKKAVKYINIFLLSLFLIACTNLEDTNGKSISEKENKLDNPQFSKTYPVNIESDNYSSRLTSNFIDQFIFFEDQGYIVVNSENLDSVDIFINDNEIDTSDHEWNDKTNYMIDISNQTKNGKNTIQVSNIQGENASLTVQIPYATVINNEEEYIDNKMTKVLDEIIEGEINYGFPSAQLTVIKNGKVKLNRSYGYLNNYYLDGSRIQENKKTPVTEKTLFDLASNTKMYVTNYALQYLISEDRLSLDTKVSKIFPEFVDNNTDWKNMIEIKDLLYHQAGFPPDPQYHNNKFTDIVNNNGENGLFS